MLSVPCISLHHPSPNSLAASPLQSVLCLSPGPMSHDPALCSRNFHKFVFLSLLRYVRLYLACQLERCTGKPKRSTHPAPPPNPSKPRKPNGFHSFKVEAESPADSLPGHSTKDIPTCQIQPHPLFCYTTVIIIFGGDHCLFKVTLEDAG